MEKLKQLIRRGISNSLPQHQATRLAEQIAHSLYSEGVRVDKG